MKIIGISLMALLQIGCSVFGIRSEETPKYTVLVKEKNMEIREYAPYIAATTRVEGSFDESLNPAFKTLAGYIFGENEKEQKISMTAPVVQAPEKIAMTAPVVQAPADGGWEMSFMMPSEYKMADLPKPKNPNVKLVEKPARTIAVIRFTGFWNEKKNRKKADELLAWLEKLQTYQTASGPMFAGYDPPWTLPFFRRNEMMIEVKKSGPK